MSDSTEAASSDTVRQFSREWWSNRPVTMPWCYDFCQPFYDEKPSRYSDDEFNHSIGIVFFNKPDGSIHPAGMVALEDGKFIFQYHPSYLADETLPAISEHLPKRKEAYEVEGRLQSFFDNLLSEGTLGKMQGKAIGQSPDSIDGDNENFKDRYHRMMMFGRDCPGAVWCTYIKIDPDLARIQHDALITESLRSRATIAGVQPKLLATMDDGQLRPTKYWETSSHIAKLNSEGHSFLPEREYMSFVATRALLPQDMTAQVHLTDLHLSNGDTHHVLAVKRFDRTEGDGRIHFEELNQLLRKSNKDRYNGHYDDLSTFIHKKMGQDGVKQVFARLISQFVLGNADSHFKNFAMFHDNASDTWKLTPSYDLAPSDMYGFKRLALLMRQSVPIATKRGRRRDNDDFIPNFVKRQPGEFDIDELDLKKLYELGHSMGLTIDEIKPILNDIILHIDDAKKAVMQDGSKELLQLDPATGKTLKEDFCRQIDVRSQRMFGFLMQYKPQPAQFADRDYDSGRSGMSGP